jgi:AefR-like transcriptional repressor, C-terminal domain
VFVFDELPAGPDLNSSVERLVKLGEAVVSAITQPQVIRMTLLMAERADQHPQLAAAFYAAGRGELLKRVAACLKALTKRGFLSIKNPDLAAEQLVASWSGMSLLRQGLGVASRPPADEIAEHVRYAVDTMIRAWSTRRGSYQRENQACQDRRDLRVHRANRDRRVRKGLQARRGRTRPARTARTPGRKGRTGALATSTSLHVVRQDTCDAQNNCSLSCNPGETLASVICPSGTVSISKSGHVETASCGSSPGPALSLCMRP